MAVMEFANVSFRYPTSKEQVLKEVSFQVQKGEFIVLCGASGSGKTTLLKHMIKSQIPIGIGSGSMYFAGADIETMDDRVAASQIAYVGQDPEHNIVTDYVWQELAFGLESLGMSVPQMRRRTAEMAEYFGLESLFRKRTAALSGGQKQLVQLAAAMVVQPKLLVLDEPTSQLDPMEAGRFLDTLAKLHEEFGVTIFLSEQRLDGVLPIADRVFVMEDGTVTDTTPRRVGHLLKERHDPVYAALPTAAKTALCCGESGDLPLTVREGKVWLRDYLKAHSEVSLETTVERITKMAPEISVSEYFGNVDIEKPDIQREDRTTILHASQVSYGYEKGKPVLRDFDWKLPRGSIYCIMGSNGSGKSTALKVMAGIYKPQRGRVITKAKCTYLPQNPKAVFSETTVEEELTEFLYRRGSREAEVIETVEQMLRFVELCEVRQRHPYDLSGGQMQRLAVAKALLTKPEILLLDEPTKGLDAALKEKLGQYIQKIVATGVTVVIVSHDVEFCADYATDCALLFDGNLIGADAANSFFADNYFYTPAVQRLFANEKEDA